MAKILSISPVGSMPVYDMYVYGLHNYITSGGTVLHNCDAIRYYCISRTLPTEIVKEQESYIDEDEYDEDYDSYMAGGEATASYIGF